MISKMISSLDSIALHTNESHHPMENWSMMGGAWWVWFILIIGVILVIVVLVVLLMEEDHNKGTKSDTMKSAEQILDERYAKGEITGEEYREKKKEMKK